MSMCVDCGLWTVELRLCIGGSGRSDPPVGSMANGS
jgi:hypothetical protein